jgi:hypothetical protein
MAPLNIFGWVYFSVKIKTDDRKNGVRILVGSEILCMSTPYVQNVVSQKICRSFCEFVWEREQV